MPQIKVDDILIREQQMEERSVCVDGVWVRGTKYGDPWRRKYKVLAIGNCGRVGLRSLGAGSDLLCTNFKDWSTFCVIRNGEDIGQAEHCVQQAKHE